VGLLEQSRAAAIHTFSVADHATVAAVAESASLAADAGLQFVPGIGVTSVHRGKDVHVLGYFFDPDSPDLLSFLAANCAGRLRCAREMADKLAALGVPIDIDALIAQHVRAGLGSVRRCSPR
jgi:predicted metal-dependent phosphoesterase TrpH